MDSLDELMARAAQPVEEQKDSLDDLMAASAMGEVGAVRAGAMLAADSNPDEIARQKRIAASLGVPLAAVEADPAFATREQKMRQIEQATAQSPALRQKFTNEDFVKLAHDNVDNLSAIAQTFTVARKLGRAGIEGLRSASAGSVGLARMPFDIGAAALEPLVGTILPENPLARGAKWLADYQQEISGTAKANMPKGEGNIESGIYSGVASLTRNVAALPMALLPGGQEAALGMMVAPVGGEAYGEGRDQGLSIPRALSYAGSQAAIEYATEKLPLTKLLGDLKEGTPFMKTLLGNAAREVPGEQLATALQDMNDWAVLPENADKPFSSYIDERPDAFVQTLIATLVGTGGQVTVMEGVSKAVGYAEKRATKAMQAEQSAAFIGNINQLAAADKLLQRDADSFEAFVAAASEDGPVDTVFVDGRMLMQSGMAPKLAEMSPAVRDQLDRAILTSGDIAIPVAEYATRIAPTDLAPQLLDHLKTSPDGFTRAEAQDFMANQGAELQAEVERILTDRQDADTFRASQDMVKQDILGQLNTAGRFTPQVNEAYATLASSYAAVRAAQLGMTPEAFHAERGMRVQGAAVAGQQFSQLTIAEMDKVKGLQQDLAATEAKYEPLRKRKLWEGDPEWDSVTKEAAAIRTQLYELTGDWYGKPKKKLKPPSEDLLNARYDSPDAVPAEVRSWIQQNAATLTSDATDAVRFGRIIDTLNDDRYPSGELTIYRAVSGDDIRPGDWVSTSREYAEDHLQRYLNGKGRVIEETVDGRDVLASPTGDAAEAIYAPRYLSGPVDPADPNILNQSANRSLYEKAWRILASNDAIFQHPLPDSFDMGEAAQEINRKMFAREDALDAEEEKHLAKKWHVTMPDGTHAYVMENQQGEVWIDASRLEEGASGGTRLYLLVGSYAEGNGKVFIGDPAGLSDVALIRRTENMLSLALRFGKTNFMRPHEYQMNPDAKQGTVLAGVVRPLGWVEGDDANNIEELIRTSYANTINLAPEIKDVTFNFDKQRFEQDGREFTKEDFTGVLDRLSDSLRQRGLDRILGHAVRDTGGKGGETRYFAPIGSATLKRAIVTNTLAREARAGRGGDVLAEISRFVSGELTGLAGTLYQPAEEGPRGGFSPATNLITLLKNADLTTFLHESAHYFFENDIGLASELVQKESLTPGEQQIVDDVSKLLTWHGIQGDINEQLRTWHTMDFEEQRSHHERTAESFEAYLFSGKAPSLELQPIFQRFASWMISVYKSLKDFLKRNPEAGKLNDEVRSVFDRMIATQEEIALAEQARSMMPLFSSPETSGMNPEEYAKYQAQGTEATATAVDELQAKGLRDMQWLANAKGRQVAKLKREAKGLRAEVELEARREVMSQPVYQAWGFLTRKMGQEDVLPALERKSDPEILDPTFDSLFIAIAKLGGIKKDQVISEWGVDPKDTPQSGLFGKPVWRITEGLTLNGMAAALAEHGYLPLDENGKYELNDLGDRFLAELAGETQYSHAYQPQDLQPGEQIVNPAGLGAGRIDLAGLASLGVPDEVTNALKARKMTAKEGLHPDLVATMFDFSSGDELVRTLAAAQSPKEAITELADQMMLQRHGELATPEAIELAADAAIHNDARARFVATEYNALAKALGETEQVGTDKNGRPIMRRILESAAKEYAAAMIARLKVKDIRPSQYANAETRAAKASAKALRVASESTEAEAVKSATESLNNAKQRLESALSAEPVFNEDGEVDTTEIDKAQRNIHTQEGRLRSAEERYRIAQRGSLKVAAEEKRNQVINTYATRAAYEAKDEVDRIIRHFKQIKKPGSQKNMRGDHLLQMNALLARFDLRAKTDDTRAPLADWVIEEADRLSAAVPAMPDWILDEQFVRPYRDLTVVEMRDLADSVAQLEHLARREQKMYKAVHNMNYQAEVSSIMDELRTTNPDAFDKDGPIEYRKDALPLVKEMRGRIKSKFDAEFINVENLLDSITSGKGRQIFESLFGRLSAAQDARTAMMKELGGFLREFTKAYSAQEKLDMTFAKRLVPNTRLYMTREQRISVVLFNGSEEGRQRLRDGNRYNEQQIQAIIDSLDEKDIALVQAMWRMSDEKVWPQLAAVNERTVGIAPPKVKAVPFTHSTLGALSGGYVPLVYDGDMDTRAHDLNTNSSVQEMLGGTITQAATQRSASKTRSDVVNRPLDLSLRGMAFKINETVHDITHREAVADTYRLLQNRELSNTLRTIAGPDAYNSILYHVREVAVKPRTPSGFMEKAFWYLRKNTLINMMGASFNTVAINVLGASPAIRRVGAARFMAAAGKLTGPGAVERYNAILEKSAYMKQRLASFDRDMNEELSRLSPSSLMPSLQFWFAGLSVMDRAITMPTWLASYEQGLAQFKNEESAAIDFADRVVRQTQGSGRAVDLAKIAGGVGPAGEFKRILTMFYNFFGAQLGSIRRGAAVASGEFSAGNRAKAAGIITLDVLAIIVIPATLEAIARGNCGDDPDAEDYLYCAVRSSTLFTGGFFPILRDVLPYTWRQFDPDFQGGFGARLSPIENALETIARVPKSTADTLSGEATEIDEKTLVRGFGYMFGLPGFQAWRTLDGYRALSEGETENPAVLLTGPPKD